MGRTCGKEVWCRKSLRLGLGLVFSHFNPDTAILIIDALESFRIGLPWV